MQSLKLHQPHGISQLRYPTPLFTRIRLVSFFMSGSREPYHMTHSRRHLVASINDYITRIKPINLTFRARDPYYKTRRRKCMMNPIPRNNHFANIGRGIPQFPSIKGGNTQISRRSWRTCPMSPLLCLESHLCQALHLMHKSANAL